MKMWTIVWGLGALLALYGVVIEDAYWHLGSLGICALMAWGCASDAWGEKEGEDSL